MTRTHAEVGDAPGSASGAHDPSGEPPGCLAPGGAAEHVDEALRLVTGRWKLAILFQLYAAPVRRFSALERAIPGVSQKMLAQHLRALERDGLVARTVHPEVPPRVEYRLTSVGEALRPALAALRDWAAARRDGLPHG